MTPRPSAEGPARSWLLTILGEMATRAGMARESESHFREALSIEPADTYLLGSALIPWVRYKFGSRTTDYCRFRFDTCLIWKNTWVRPGKKN